MPRVYTAAAAAKTHMLFLQVRVHNRLHLVWTDFTHTYIVHAIQAQTELIPMLVHIYSFGALVPKPEGQERPMGRKVTLWSCSWNF